MAGFRRLGGYTLVELLIVIGITVLLLSLTIAGMGNSQKSFLFSNAYEKVIQVVREARSNAVTGKATLDYNDYDGDTYTNTVLQPDGAPDYVTPAAYGVDFDIATGKVTAFADLHKSATDAGQKEGVYDAPTSGSPAVFQLNKYIAGKDLALAQFTIAAPLKLVLAVTSPVTTRQQIFFTPIFADVTIVPALTSPNKFFIFGVSEGSATGRYRCGKIHPIAGVPEVATPVECPF